ncbi:hypothetical protein OG21DRAFT_1372566, partial [Imleria badia]
LQKHVKKCWGSEIMAAANDAKDTNEARKKIVGEYLRDGTITTSFECKGKGKVSYSHWQHTRTKTHAEIVRWVAESLRPFKIVADRGFQLLMKMGRLEHYILSPSTVSRDIKLVFARTCQQIAKMLQDYSGKVSFMTDAWTSPNH